MLYEQESWNESQTNKFRHFGLLSWLCYLSNRGANLSITLYVLGIRIQNSWYAPLHSTEVKEYDSTEVKEYA